ncbi:zinc ribbon domain-containing protein [Mycolicibacterium komossense]|uniref:Zinc ribbon domain-containing protein n=1 Tax=Mycolicibacterium komossense TaxID=1779 RepID=A0ABT3C7H5_9MYCO|nr:zinc ribbon domain-containing protein [Mycolicibacterium komossense]MCV7225412.1 zinc ribbon domain-containing protein [Mycolicibacterium komossense]
MTDHPETPGEAYPGTMPCHSCDHDVPAGRFCARCGAQLSAVRGDGPRWLRIRDYAAAPGENVLQPSIVSSVFPYLSNRSSGAFRVLVWLVLATLVVLCAFQLEVAMVAAATFAPPLLFLVYLKETGVIGDLLWRVWVPTFAVGIGVGAAWALWTNGIVAESYSLGLGVEVPTARLVLDALIIPFGGLFALQLPAVLIWVSRPPRRDSLYGFAVGALGGTMFAVGATVVRLVSQIGRGEQANDQPVADMLLEAGIRGVTMPLMAVSIGGLIGAALWYRSADGQGRRGVWTAIVVGSLAAPAVYACVGLVDVLRITPYLQFVVHAAIALVAVLALRTGLQLAMLHEIHEPTDAEQPILCADCGHVVPDMAFCPACGVASQAASRASRAARRQDRPQPSDEQVGR